MTRVLFLFLAAATIAPPAYAQVQSGSCKPVFDAMLKETTTPHHIVTTKDGSVVGEAIATADTTYIKVRGVWKTSPLSPQKMLAQQQENIRDTTKASCTKLPDDLAGGQPATVYQTHYEQKDLGASDAKVWIAKATGLPLRTDVSLQAGEKTSVVSQFDYDNIKAPIVK